MSFAKLDDLCRKLEALEHALAILGADEATHMAVGGGEKRAEAVAALAGMVHRQATAPDVADWIAAAETETLPLILEENPAKVVITRQTRQGAQRRRRMPLPPAQVAGRLIRPGAPEQGLIGGIQRDTMIGKGVQMQHGPAPGKDMPAVYLRLTERCALLCDV